MPFLKEQIQIVNDALRATALADKRFEAGRFETLAVDVNRKDSEGKIEGFPAIMSENYEAQEITVNDTYPIIIYHKALQKTYQKQGAGEFGDRDKGVVERVLMKMVVYAKWSAVKMRQEQLEALITTNFPDNFLPAVYQPLKLNSMSADMKGSNLNSAAVWNEEYRNIPLALAPEDIYFSINYELSSAWRKGCFKICDCE
jgi:hypothetical protein